MKPIIIALLLAGTAWGQQAAHPDPVPRGWALMQLPVPVPPLLQPHHKAPPGIDITGTCREPSANYGCEYEEVGHQYFPDPVHASSFGKAGPIGFVRASYYGAYQAITNVLDHAQLNNAEWENLYSLAHAVNNVYLFLGTSKATETDAEKAKLALDALHIGEKLARYHIPTHEEDMDELLRRMDGWGKKL